MINRIFEKSESQFHYDQVYSNYCVVNEYSTLPNNGGNSCHHWVNGMIKQFEAEPKWCSSYDNSLAVNEYMLHLSKQYNKCYHWADSICKNKKKKNRIRN